MRTTLSRALAGIAVTAALAASSSASAVNLVTNGGFETGDFSGWTQFGNKDSLGVTGITLVTSAAAAVHEGSFGASFGPVGTAGGISQLLTTTPGTKYIVEFWLKNEADVLNAVTPNSFSFKFGDSQLSLSDFPAAFPYSHFKLTALAADASTQLKFTFRHDPAFWDLDAVSVSAVPEAGSLAMFTLGGVMLGVVVRRRRGTTAA